MRFGIGLPATAPGAEGPELLAWARAAERAGFSTVAALDRLLYGNYEPLIALAAAAAVTQRARLMTTILCAPYRVNAALLAKQVASLDRLAGGRVTLGLGLGAREDDYTASGADWSIRGAELDRMIAECRSAWSTSSAGAPAAALGPAPSQDGGPPMIVGGWSPLALQRAGERADGWIGAAESFAEPAAEVRRIWSEAGRPGAPRLLAVAWFALGAERIADGEQLLRDYYGFAPPFAELQVRGLIRSASQVRETVEGFAQAGCDEVIFLPAARGEAQVGALAQALNEFAGS